MSKIQEVLFAGVVLAATIVGSLALIEVPSESTYAADQMTGDYDQEAFDHLVAEALVRED